MRRDESRSIPPMQRSLGSPPGAQLAAAVAVAALIAVATGCSSEIQTTPDSHAVYLRIDGASIELLSRSSAPAEETLPLHAERMLSYELRSSAGEIVAAGRVPDPRSPRAEWSAGTDTMAAADGSYAEGVVSVVLPKTAGQLVVFEDSAESGVRELGRAAFDPDGMPVREADAAADAVRGSPKRIDLLFVSEGYTAAELEVFASDVDALVAALEDRDDVAELWPRIAIHRHAVASAESGIDDASAEVAVDTAFDVGHGGGGARRCLWPQTAAGHERAQRLARDASADLVVLVANTDEPGGCAAGLATVSRASGDILMHELGHAIAGLADEYEIGRDPVACAAHGTDHPNVSSSPAQARLPWSDRVTALRLPTPDDFEGEIGAYEGADGCAQGRYRAEGTCLMRQLGAPLCSVCRAALSDVAEVVAAGELPSPAPLSCDPLARLAGANRYETAAAISEHLYPGGAGVAVIASGDDVSPDALVAGPLAVHLGGPLLLSDRDSLPEATAAELQRLGASEVVIVGGESVVGAGVAADLQSRGLSVRRLAGDSRYTTAVAIAEEIGATDGLAFVVAARDENLVDALAAAGPAGSLGAPILFVDRDSVPPTTADALTELGITRTVVVGGGAAISDAVVQRLPAPDRVAGADRFGTAVAMAHEARARGIDSSRVYLARSDLFPDALAAGAAGRIVLLAATEVMPAETGVYLSDYADEVFALGGEGALGPDVETAACTALCGGQVGCLRGCGDGICDVNGQENDVSCAQDCGCSAPGACDGSNRPSTCFCDPGCERQGDCCADVLEACSVPYPERSSLEVKSLQPDLWPNTDEIVDAGTSGVVINFFWPHWQPANRTAPCDDGEEEYEGHCFVIEPGVDGLVREYSERGLRVTGAFYGVPDWANASRSCSGVWCAPDDPSAYGRFVGMLARRFDGRSGHGHVADFIIHNEVNHNDWFNVGCGGGVACDLGGWLDTYAQNFNEAYDRIVQTRADARVLIPLTHHFGSELDNLSASQPRVSGMTWIAGLAPRLGNRAWRIAYHPYPNRLVDPDFSPHDFPYITYGNIGMLSGWLRQTFADRPSAWEVHLTESGVNSSSPYSSEALQAEGVCGSLRNVVATPDVENYVYHRMIDHADEGVLQVGLFRSDGSPKPAWTVWSGANQTGTLDCGFEDLPYLRLTRWRSGAGYWTSTRLPPPGYSREISVGLWREAVPNSRMLFECNNGDRNFITTDAGCEGKLPLGPVGYALTTPAPGTVPVHRCNGSRGHFVSTDAGCEGATLEGVLGYAMP